MGTTLIEAMLGVIVLGLFAVPIASTFFITDKVNINAKTLLSSNTAANRIMEKINVTVADATGPEGLEFNNQEYSDNGIDSSVFKVIKKISIIKGDDITPKPTGYLKDNLKGGDSLLSLGTSTPGMITNHITDGNICGYSMQNPSIDVILCDGYVRIESDVGNTQINGSFGYLSVYQSEEKMTVHFRNQSKTVKSLYIINPTKGVANGVTVTYDADPSPWNVYNNLSTEDVFPCTISLADITIDVQNIKTGETYETHTQKPLYDFSATN